MAQARSSEKGIDPSMHQDRSPVSEGDPVTQQHELLVSEIESTDGHLGTALRFGILLPDIEIVLRYFLPS